MKIQELFNEIKDGNRNAVGELHRNLRIHMAPDGVFTHIYKKFHMQIADREDTNQDIVLLVWNNIIEGKCDKMQDWNEMKSYSSTICYRKCLELVKKKPTVPIDGIIIIANVEIDLNKQIKIETGLTTEIEEILDEIYKLFTDKCKFVWKIIRLYPSRMKDNDFILEKLLSDIEYREKKHTVPELGYIPQLKSSCLITVQNKMNRDPKFDHWKEQFKDFIDYIGDN